MKKIVTFLKHLMCFAVLMSVTSCLVNRPDLTGVTKKDYNSRREVKGARFVKRLNVPGIILTAAAPVAGAVAGYNMNIVTMQKGTETKPVKPANAAIGAVAGYTVANFVNYCFGLNKRVTNANPEEWTKRINKDYRYIPETQKGNNFVVIDKHVESSYQVKNLNDTKQFYAVFPTSSYRDRVFKNSIEVCGRNDMPELLALDSKNRYADEAKKKYIVGSNTYEDLTTAVFRYPGIPLDYESMFASKVKNVANAIDFKTRFPNSSELRSVVWKAFITEVPTKSDVGKMKNTFGKDFELNKDDLRYGPTDIQKRRYLNAAFQMANVRNGVDLESFYRKYDWLDCNGKAYDLVSNLFDVMIGSGTDGNYLLYCLRKLPGESLYKKWGVTSTVVNNCIDNKMQNEKSKIRVVSTKSLGSNHGDWDSWLSNTVYTAGLVAEKGDVKYIIYGEIENASSFDMPVTITADADLMLQARVKGSGFLKEFLAMFGVTVSPGEKTKQKITNQSGQFYIPSMPAHSKSSYAILMNFGAHGKSGVNVADWFKIIADVYLDHVNVTTSVGSKQVSDETLSMQENWLYMAKNGLPEVQLTDLKRKERVDPEVWAQRWEVERKRREEAARYAAAEAARRKAAEDQQKAIQESVEKEMKNRQYSKEYHSDYDVVFPSGHVVEWHIRFGDNTGGTLAYMDWNKGWYCHPSFNPGTTPNQAIGINWSGPYKAESEAINELYEILHE